MISSINSQVTLTLFKCPMSRMIYIRHTSEWRASLYTRVKQCQNVLICIPCPVSINCVYIIDQLFKSAVCWQLEATYRQILFGAFFIMSPIMNNFLYTDKLRNMEKFSDATGCHVFLCLHQKSRGSIFIANPQYSNKINQLWFVWLIQFSNLYIDA